MECLNLPVNILYTVTRGFEEYKAEENISNWRREHQIVELMPSNQLVRYLRLETSSCLALIDAIVCSADGVPFSSTPERPGIKPNYPLEQAISLAWDVRDLPESCAMRDGRKWRSIPFIIFRGIWDHYWESDAQNLTHAQIEFVPYGHPTVMLNRIRTIVEKYQDRVLDDYACHGILVRFESGRWQIGPALKRKNNNIESEYYYQPSDRRHHSGWVTFKRDQFGLGRELDIFQQLLSNNANESEMHRFFEEQPDFLMQARMGVPISHRPTFSNPQGWRPDFTLSPILGPRESEIEILEIKGPGEKLLTRGLHRGFSAKVKSAIDQVRDYDDCFRDSANSSAIFEALGYIPKKSRLAVLIGRDPDNLADRAIADQRQSQVDVRVITYDEILATQSDQL